MGHLAKQIDKNTGEQLLACYEIVARHLRATPFQLSVSFSEQIECSVRKSEVERIDANNSYQIHITAYKGNKRGTASGNSIKKQDIITIADKAIFLADFANSDIATAPIEGELLANYFPDLALRTAPVIGIDDAISFARTVEDEAFAYSKLIQNSEGASVQYVDTHSLFATNTKDDFYVIDAENLCSAAVSVIAAQTSEEMQLGWHWARSRDSLADMSGIKIGAQAARDAVNSLNARPVPTGTYSVVFAPEVANGLLATFLRAISGHRLYKKTTFLQESINKKLFPAWFNVIEAPFLPRAWGSESIDDEGVGRQEKVIVEKGVLLSYLFDCYSARKLNTKTTGNAGGVTNIEITHSDLTYEEILKEMQTGIVVTSMMGDASNLITGDYSRGAKGFFVKNGEIQHPVEEVTVSCNLRDMFTNLRAIGKDIDRRSRYLTGSWLVDKMIVATSK